MSNTSSKTKRPRCDSPLYYDCYTLVKEMEFIRIRNYSLMLYEARAVGTRNEECVDSISCIRLDDIFDRFNFNNDRRIKSSIIQRLKTTIGIGEMLLKLHDNSYVVLDKGAHMVFEYLVANGIELIVTGAILVDIDECSAVALKNPCDNFISKLKRRKNYFECQIDGSIYRYALRPFMQDIIHSAKIAGLEIIITTKADQIIAKAFHDALGLQSNKIFSALTFKSTYKSLLDMETSSENCGFSRKNYTKLLILDDNPFNFLADIMLEPNVLACPIRPVNNDSVANDSYFKTLAQYLKQIKI